MFLKILSKITVPINDEERKKKLHFLSNPKDVKIILDFFLNILLTNMEYIFLYINYYLNNKY